MKVIDLIDMKEKPKIIELMNNQKYYLNENSYEFRTLYEDEDGCNWYDNYLLVLNEDIKIIEEGKNIEKIDYTDHVGIDLSEIVCERINELIDEINKLKKEGKKNE